MVTSFLKLCSQKHSLACSVTNLISSFLYALLAFNLKTISFTRFLQHAVRFFPWPGPEDTITAAAVAVGSLFRSLLWHLYGLQAPGHLFYWKQIHPYSAAHDARPWGSLWPPHLLLKQLFGLQRPGCSKHPTQCRLGPSEIKIIRRAVLEVFCSRFPDGCHFVPLLAVISLCGAFGESCTMRGMGRTSASGFVLGEGVGLVLGRCEPACLGWSS